MKMFHLAVWLALPLLMFSSAAQAKKNCPSETELFDALTTETDQAAALLRHVPETKFRDSGRSRGKAVGKVQTVQGSVLIISADGYNASHLRHSLPLPLFQGDTVITAAKSRVILLMQDGSRLALAAQSKMIIDQAVYDPGASRRDTKLRLLLGRLRAVVAKMAGKSSYRIQTPAAAAGVRGTDFALAASPTLTVLLTGGGSSAVELTDRKGGSVKVGPLSAAGVEDACPVCPPEHVGNRALTVLHDIAPELDSPATGCWPIIRWSCN